MFLGLRSLHPKQDVDAFRWLGGLVVSIVAFSPRGREFDARGLLRFQLPGEA